MVKSLLFVYLKVKSIKVLDQGHIRFHLYLIKQIGWNKLRKHYRFNLDLIEKAVSRVPLKEEIDHLVKRKQK